MDNDPELVSARGAAEILAEGGFSRAIARRLLAAGLAGTCVATPSAHLYDAERVRELLTRDCPDLTRLPPPCDRSFLEQRVAPGSSSEAWSRLSNLGTATWLVLLALLHRDGYFPLVRTTCGFVLEGAEVTSVLQVERRAVRLVTRAAGPWFAAFERRRLPSAPGHNWSLRAEGFRLH